MWLALGGTTRGTGPQLHEARRSFNQRDGQMSELPPGACRDAPRRGGFATGRLGGLGEGRAGCGVLDLVRGMVANDSLYSARKLTLVR